MSTITRVIFTAIGLWCLALILLFIFPHVLPLATGFAGLVSLAVGLLLLVLALIALIKERRKLLPLISIALIMGVAYIAAARMVSLGAQAYLCLHKARYQATANRMLEARDDEERKRICGEECWLLSSDPDRVAFHYVHGFLNWHDIVYDPSGTLSGIETWDEKKRLDMYFIHAEHLTGDWYIGHFGD